MQIDILSLVVRHVLDSGVLFPFLSVFAVTAAVIAAAAGTMFAWTFGDALSSRLYMEFPAWSPQEGPVRGAIRGAVAPRS